MIVTIAQWENEYISPSVLSMGRGSRPWQSIPRDYPWLITCAALNTGLVRPKARTTAKTVVRSGVAPS